MPKLFLLRTVVHSISKLFYYFRMEIQSGPTFSTSECRGNWRSCELGDMLIKRLEPLYGVLESRSLPVLIWCKSVFEYHNSHAGWTEEVRACSKKKSLPIIFSNPVIEWEGSVSLKFISSQKSILQFETN